MTVIKRKETKKKGFGQRRNLCGVKLHTKPHEPVTFYYRMAFHFPTFVQK